MNVLASCFVPDTEILFFFLFFLFTKSLKSLRSLVLVLILQKQEVGQQAEKVMLLSAMNCSDGPGAWPSSAVSPCYQLF